MLLAKRTNEFDHLLYIPAIQRMYETNNLEEMKEFASFSQLERFRKEIETLNSFGLHKELDIKIKNNQTSKTTAKKYFDGKVDIIFSVSNADIKETYRNAKNRKRYRRKIRNGFLETTVVKTNKALSYNKENPPHCMNCGSQLESTSENFYCPFCHTKYKADAYKYLLSRFFVDRAFHNLGCFFTVLLFIFFLAILQVRGIISEIQFEQIYGVFSIILATILTILFFYFLAKGIKDLFRDRSIKKKIRRNDPNFSKEMFILRVNDLVTTHPEILITEKEKKKNIKGAICRNLLDVQLSSYKKNGNLEIVECMGKVDALYIKDKARRVGLKDKYKKVRLRVSRIYGTKTPVHYIPDQFTCKNCGSHQAIEHSGMQVCSFCRSKTPMESIDWVFY